MRKTILSILCAMMLAGCSILNEAMSSFTDKYEPVSVSETGTETEKTLSFSGPITTVKGLETDLDFTDPYQSACGVVMTLLTYETNPKEAMKMMDVMMGPESPSSFDEAFLNNQFDQYPYVMRSYFEGSTPENDYKVEQYVLHVFENEYSRDEEGYLRLYFQSSGADSERAVTLRKKGSTGEWFLFSDSYKGLTSGIRVPSGDDPWN